MDAGDHRSTVRNRPEKRTKNRIAVLLKPVHRRATAKMGFRARWVPVRQAQGRPRPTARNGEVAL